MSRRQSDGLRLASHRAAGLLLLYLACGCSLSAAEPETVYQHGVVAADHPLASAAGVEMLQRGGNVVDAAVATSFALSVVRPESCGIGGGGFMVIWNAEATTAIALDYRERAPLLAHARMFLPPSPDSDADPPDSRHGGLAAAIPGNVAGLCYALEHYGSLDLPTVLAPAIRYATDGFAFDASGRRNRRSTRESLQRLADGPQRFRTLDKLYLQDADDPESSERFDSPLEHVLQHIAQSGPSGFYKGEVAEALLAAVHAQGGVWTREDLNPQHLVVEREPLVITHERDAILTMPPPSSGGIALIEMLNILAACDAKLDEPRIDHNSVEYVHLLTEASKHAFADRATYLGDADFVAVPVNRLISPRYAERLAGRIDPLHTQPPETYGRRILPNDGGTSHISVIDAAGNAVACTETINTLYGSYVVEPRFGVILNNEMDDFTARPGEPNAFGLIQSELNAVAPGKKPLSSMTPTIFVRDGRAILAVGASGGPRIISGTTQVLLNMTQFGLTPEAAVAAPRFHHQ
ncbi:MAG: gamma-glutamyltransferase, partial [Planctomycetaceae bacterium]|nr:gamma-glutamyltransferase [Planctomycetaceae bacterium]